MSYHAIDSKQKIKELIDFLLSNKSIITIQIEGSETVFTSRIIKVDYGNPFSSAAEEPLLTIKHLTPDRGNDLFNSYLNFCEHGTAAPFLIERWGYIYLGNAFWVAVQIWL